MVDDRRNFFIYDAATASGSKGRIDRKSSE